MDSTSTVEAVTIGANCVRVSVASVRRALAVGTTVQLHRIRDLATDVPDTSQKVRTVTKQTTHQMVTTVHVTMQGSYFTWAHTTAARDDSGAYILFDRDEHPLLAYRVIDEPADVVTHAVVSPDLQDRTKEARASRDAAVLADIANSAVPANRAEVAANPQAPADLLDLLSSDSAAMVRRSVAANPTTPVSTMERLSEDSDVSTDINQPSVRFQLAKNPATPGHVLSRIAHSDHSDLPRQKADGLRIAIAYHSNATAVTLEHLATVPADGYQYVSVDVQQAVASNPNTPRALLARWEHGHGYVTAQVAKNPSTPSDVLSRLAFDTTQSNHVPSLVAANPSTPSDVVTMLAASDDPWIVARAAKNRQVPSVVLAALASSAVADVRAAVARNEATPVGTLTRLQADPEPSVRAALVANPVTPAATLHALSGDTSGRVKRAFERHRGV